MSTAFNCDILLIPPEINPVFSEDKKFMPLGLLALAASLRKNAINVKIYQPEIRLFKKEDFRKAANHILLSKPKYIGFSTWCNSFSTSLIIAEEIKKINPKIPVIFGGPQASILPEIILKEFPFVDFVLAGEADYSLPHLIKNLLDKDSNYSNIPGLTYRNNKNEIFRNEIKAIVQDLNDLPIPAYDLVPKATILKLDVGRGCPFQCIYCSSNNFFSNKYRIKSAERIINEMDQACDKANITSFSFAHDLFTFNKKYIFDFCTKLIYHNNITKRNYSWTCSARTDCVSEELIEKMKLAGCKSVFFGIESGSIKIQKSIKKNLDLNKVYAIANKCREVNLNIYASFIIGFPDETKTDIEKTLKMILLLASKGSIIQVSELAVLPGTPLYSNYFEKLKFDGKITNFSHSIIGKFEKEFIKKFPSLFSSFYYLPVKSISRNSILILCQFINVLREFRNTLYLLEDEINKDIEDYYILDIFLQIKNEIKRYLSSGCSTVSLLINIISKYLQFKFNNEIPLQIKNVFIWESAQNLLKHQYACWHLIEPEVKHSRSNFQPEKIKSGKFNVSPVWRTLNSNYDLNQLIPEKNNWQKKTGDINSGNQYYLITAKSDKFCNLYTINLIEFELLDVLQKDSKENFLKQANNIYDPTTLNEWLLNLTEIGVILQQND